METQGLKSALLVIHPYLFLLTGLTKCNEATNLFLNDFCRYSLF